MGGRSAATSPGGSAPIRTLLFVAVFLLTAPLVLAGPAGASTAKGIEAPAHTFAASPCTTIQVLRHGTKVVTVRGTKVVTVRRVKVVRVRVRRHGRLVWVRRRVPYRHRERVVYRHPKRVVYRFHVPRRHCPPPRPTASLTASASTVPAIGGPVSRTFSATKASSCTLASSPPLWSGSDPMSVACSGSYQAGVPATSSARSWTVTFTAGDANGQHATSVRTLVQQAPAPAPTVPVVTTSGGGGGGGAGFGGGGGAPAPSSGGTSPPAPAPLAISTTALPEATEGDAYATQLAASGGTEPYTWAVTGGTLPKGLTLSSTGELAGTATTAGTTSVTVQVTDASAPTHETASASLSIAVVLPPFPGQQSANWAG